VDGKGKLGRNSRVPRGNKGNLVDRDFRWQTFTTSERAGLTVFRLRSNITLVLQGTGKPNQGRLAADNSGSVCYNLSGPANHRQVCWGIERGGMTSLRKHTNHAFASLPFLCACVDSCQD
jgi:hypothetical protein